MPKPKPLSELDLHHKAMMNLEEYSRGGKTRGEHRANNHF